MSRRRKPIEGVVLRRAREAARAEDWPRASAQYDLYWDVTEGDYVSVGVRRSYVVTEWAKVGRSYPLARERMRERLIESLARFGRTGERWWLQDAAAIDEALGTRAAIKLTVRLHAADHDRAADAAICLWERLIKAGHAEVVGRIQDFERMYRPLIPQVDIHARARRRGFAGASPELAQKWFRERVRLLLGALAAVGRDEERANLEERARRDAESRGFSLEG
jgi:hypothetical protein